MRLISTTTYEIHDSGEAVVVANPSYAILSHRWQPPEISLQNFSPADLRDASLQTPQLHKIRQACAKARERATPLDWLWIDSCCIDKTNAVEETRSINSMFDWYRRATVCIAYLYDVDERAPGPHMFQSQNPNQSSQNSQWFHRGWTLQELLAPRNMEFYGRHWRFMGTKRDLAGIVGSVTRIDEAYLTGASNLKAASVATRLGWMAGRTTTVVEDIAYSLLGILGVNMTLQYGEGANAFLRLQRTLMEVSADESLFAWTVPTAGLTCYQSHGQTPMWSPARWGLLAPSPDCFKKYGDIVVIQDRVVPRLAGGYRWTQHGVQFEMPMKASTEATTFFGSHRKEITLPLNCWRYNSNGKLLTIQLHLSKTGNAYSRVQCNDLDQKSGAKPSTNTMMGIDQLLTRPLTITQPPFDPFD